MIFRRLEYSNSPLARQALQNAASLSCCRNYGKVLVPREETMVGIEQRILREEFPQQFTYLDLCSGTAVQCQAADTYPRHLARSFPESTIYCLDFDFVGHTIDNSLSNLHYLQSDLASPLALVPIVQVLVMESRQPLYISGFNIPIEIAQQAVQWCGAYQARSFLGSMSGVEELAGRWEPSSKLLSERLSPREVATINEHLCWMDGLRSPCRHDYFAEDNAKITAIKQVVALDQALVLEEQGYMVQMVGVLPNPGPQNWSRADLFIEARKKTA